METASFRHARSHNVCSLDRVEGAREDRPALRCFETVNRILCDDRMTGALAGCTARRRSAAHTECGCAKWMCEMGCSIRFIVQF